MGMTINDNDVCKCGCYWNSNGACTNGHWKDEEHRGYMIFMVNGKMTIVKNDKYSNQATIEIKINSGNCPMQADEELWFKYEIDRLVKSRNMHTEEIKVYR
jgi:hypothetical protein